MNMRLASLILGIAIAPSISFAGSDLSGLCWAIKGGENAPVSECSELTSPEDQKLCNVIVWGQPSGDCSILSVEEDKNFCGVIIGGPNAPEYGCEGLNRSEMRDLCEVIVSGPRECSDL